MSGGRLGTLPRSRRWACHCNSSQCCIEEECLSLHVVSHILMARVNGGEGGCEATPAPPSSPPSNLPVPAQSMPCPPFRCLG